LVALLLELGANLLVFSKPISFDDRLLARDWTAALVLARPPARRAAV
jgi:hypothetical protein